jgi:FdhD protein
VESLAEATRPVDPVTGSLRLQPGAIKAAMADLSGAQRLNREARAIHGAAFWRPEDGLVAIREDVGRHNALDKLSGALARTSEPCSGGLVLLTSRVSVEMVQKTARMGAPVLVAISAPTALAVRVAESCGITLVAVARGDAFEVFTHPERMNLQPPLGTKLR